MTEESRSAKEITQLLQAWSDGKSEALGELLPAVYDELHLRAHRHLRRERAGHTLQTTALIHEAFVKLVEQKSVPWQNRAHFFAISANLMRQILVDYARTRHRLKRGGSAENLPLDEAGFVFSREKSVDLVALDEALTRLSDLDAQQARIVELKFFGGLTIEEIAETSNISPATVKREWNSAKAWLHGEITKQT